MALVAAAARGDAARVRRLLLSGSTADQIDENGCSALQRSAADGHVEVVTLLLEKGADPNKLDFVHGNTALHEAAWKGYSRCVALLSSHGANLHIKNFGGFAALHLACQNGHNQSCREILLGGCDPDIQNNYGDTSLHTSARYGHAGVMRILISAECKVSEQNKNGDTALHIAAAMGRRKLSRILLESGCDKQLKNKQNETARDIAVRKELKEILDILNTPSSKINSSKKKSSKRRDKSRDRTLNSKSPSTPQKDRKDDLPNKKKTVTFKSNQMVQWSPYGCHYYPDPKCFPKPKLDSLPTEPLKKGEQYYVDLAGNICKGPVGVGYTCYCAPFFKHMEDKLNKDKQELKKHIDKAHDKLGEKVTHLELKTQGQISELTRCVAAERVLCRERHIHLEQWLTRGMLQRASERVKRIDPDPCSSLQDSPLKRTKSLELLDSNNKTWKRNYAKTLNQNEEEYIHEPKMENYLKNTSKSVEMLSMDDYDTDNKSKFLSFSGNPEDLERISHSHHSDQTSSKSPRHNIDFNYSVVESEVQLAAQAYNIVADIHVKPNNKGYSNMSFDTQSHLNIDNTWQNDPNSKIINFTGNHSTHSTRINATSPQNVMNWKSQVLQRTADDINNKMRDKVKLAQRDSSYLENISQDGYIKIPKQNDQILQSAEINHYKLNTSQQQDMPAIARKSVQELVAEAENQKIKMSHEGFAARPLQRRFDNEPNVHTPYFQHPIHRNVASEQPLRPAPGLHEVIVKSFDGPSVNFQNSVPVPVRKTFYIPPKTDGNRSESSDEEDSPIRTVHKPGLMENSNMCRIHVPNYNNREVTQPLNPPINNLNSAANSFQKPIPPLHVPRDAYFHDIPNRQRILHNSNTNHPQNDCGLPSNVPLSDGLSMAASPKQCDINTSRNRNPLCNSTGLFDAMMEDHIVREMERLPHLYRENLNKNIEIEFSKHNDNLNDLYHQSGLPTNETSNIGPSPSHLLPEHSQLSNRFQTLSINTHMPDLQSQLDRESHNDSGYSTKVCGSSQGPSPSLSGNIDVVTTNKKYNPSININSSNVKNNIRSNTIRMDRL